MQSLRDTVILLIFGSKDLALLYWETTSGNRLFTYNHDTGEEKKHSPYKEQGKVRNQFVVCASGIAKVQAW